MRGPVQNSFAQYRRKRGARVWGKPELMAHNNFGERTLLLLLPLFNVSQDGNFTLAAVENALSSNMHKIIRNKSFLP